MAPEEPWDAVGVKLNDLTAKVDERLAKGNTNFFETFFPDILRALFDPA